MKRCKTLLGGHCRVCAGVNDPLTNTVHKLTHNIYIPAILQRRNSRNNFIYCTYPYLELNPGLSMRRNTYPHSYPTTRDLIASAVQDM